MINKEQIDKEFEEIYLTNFTVFRAMNLEGLDEIEKLKYAIVSLNNTIEMQSVIIDQLQTTSLYPRLKL